MPIHKCIDQLDSICTVAKPAQINNFCNKSLPNIKLYNNKINVCN